MEKLIINSTILLFIVFILYIGISCKKDKDNRDEVRAELENLEPFNISPKISSVIDLYTEFKLTANENGYPIYWEQTDGKYSSRGDLYFYVILDNVYFTDNHGNIYETNITDSASVLYKVSPKETFTPNSEISLITEYHFECYEVSMFDGYTASKEYIFPTNSNSSLTNSLVFCEYPLPRQYNFMQNDYEFGFIKTNAKPNSLLDKALRARVTNILSTESYIAEITFDSDLSILKYRMPVLENNSIYKVEYLIESDGEYTEFYSTNYFKTSKFNTFRDKIGTILDGDHSAVTWNISPCVNSMTASDYYVGSGELLDYYEQILTTDIDVLHELEKYNYPKLVTVEIDTNLVNMNQFGYGIAKELGYSLKRPTSYIGFIPVKDFFYFFNWNNEGSFINIKLQDSEIETKVLESYQITNYSSKCYIANVIVDDIYRFKNQAINDERNDDPRVQAIINMESCNSNIYSKYYYYLYYQIPGINKIVFTGIYEFAPN